MFLQINNNNSEQKLRTCLNVMLNSKNNVVIIAIKTSFTLPPTNPYSINIRHI